MRMLPDGMDSNRKDSVMKHFLITMATVTTIGLMDNQSAQAGGRFNFSLRLGNGRELYVGREYPQRPQFLLKPAIPDSFSHRDEGFGANLDVYNLSDDLVCQAKPILWEMYFHYSRNPGFRETYREMYSLYKDAKHIRKLVHKDVHHAHQSQELNENHIASDLRNLDKLFHHIKDDIHDWSRNSHFHHRHVRQLHSKMEVLGETLHHIMENYGMESRFGVEVPVL